MLQVEHSGKVSVSVFLFWPCSMECPVFSLAILEIPFLELFFNRMALSVSFLWDMLGTIYLYFGSFEFFHLLFHLLMESILLVVFQKVIVGCWVVGVLLFMKLFLQVNLLAHFLQYLDGLGSERSLELFSFVGLSCESVIFVYYMITCA